ncbi:M23 family metallopeptidase [Sphingomonas sp. Mn802worker]|uniref:M23 family metallopeptidase n=1 Tax=Sphingomonas sp. Mn802worker TaxID=629773 RepID=UPI000381A4B1|nr:M23 family metallopeptidase [Sphingomonas sp. Mn802worker]
MTRLGAIILLIIVVVGVGFASMLSFGGVPTRVSRSADETVVAPSSASDGAGLSVPVAGVRREALHDSWGEAREGGERGHQGIDIMAPGGTPVIATADGWIEKLFESGRGGTTLYQRSADGRWVYYYAHLAGYASGLREGLRVGRGQLLGYVGDSGNAGAGNYHLHFGLSRMGAGERWWQGESVDPYPLLARPRSGR